MFTLIVITEESLGHASMIDFFQWSIVIAKMIRLRIIMKASCCRCACLFYEVKDLVKLGYVIQQKQSK